jgi:hypothetical protein
MKPDKGKEPLPLSLTASVIYAELAEFKRLRHENTKREKTIRQDLQD